MHPFLPIVSVVMNSMAALLTWYLCQHIRTDAQLLPYQNVFIVPICFALFFGMGLGIWLWTKHVRYPLFTAIALGGGLLLALRFLA
jgi:hypothetical protein